MKGEALRGIVYKCVSYDKGCYLLSDATEPVEGNDNWNAWEVKNLWSIRDNYMFKKKERVFMLNTNYH